MFQDEIDTVLREVLVIMVTRLHVDLLVTTHDIAKIYILVI